jgi:hypothetical protein
VFSEYVLLSLLLQAYNGMCSLARICSLTRMCSLTTSYCVFFFFAPARHSQLHCFSFFLQLKRGAALGFTPIVAVWNDDVKRATGMRVCVCACVCVCVCVIYI